MKLKSNLSFVLLLVVLVGCKKILFDSPMPIKATDITECPKELDGSYLSIYYTENSFSADLHRVDRKSDHEVVVYNKRCAFIDSLYLESRNLPNIDTAWFDNNLIYAKTGQSVLKFELDDTLSSEQERVGVGFDFKNELYFGAFEDTSKFKVKFINDTYYLNIERLPGLYSINQVKLINNDINFKTLAFEVRDTTNPSVEFIERYELEPQKEDRGKFYIQNYLANLNDEKFLRLVNEKDVFHSHTWYKVDSSNTHYYWIIMVVVALLTIVLIKKTKQQNI